MKLPQHYVRDLFWLTLVAALVVVNLRLRMLLAERYDAIREMHDACLKIEAFYGGPKKGAPSVPNLPQ